MSEETKICISCHYSKVVSDFYKGRNQCKDCYKTKTKEHRVEYKVNEITILQQLQEKFDQQNILLNNLHNKIEQLDTKVDNIQITLDNDFDLNVSDKIISLENEVIELKQKIIKQDQIIDECLEYIGEHKIEIKHINEVIEENDKKAIRTKYFGLP